VRFRTESRSDGARAGKVLLLVALMLPAAVLAEASGDAAACSLSDEILESSGARIGEITITARNIFDLDNPEEDKAFFRFFNRLHVRTRDPIIARQLLFEPGTPFDRSLLEESERLLRATDYLYDADITITRCDADTVDVEVETRDVWTLKPGFSVSRSGGESRIGFDLQEDNFLGRGGSIRFLRSIDEERRTTEVGYADRNVGGRWISVATTLADNSDGHVFALNVARPFYALDTRWAAGGRMLDEKSEEPVYSLGDEIGKFSQDINFFELHGGWSRGLVDGWTTRWLAGLVHDDRIFGNVEDSLVPGVIPESRRLIYPFIEYQLIEDKFLRAANLNQIYRTEDVMVGVQARLRLGWLAPVLGADRGGAIFSGSVRRGYGNPEQTLWDITGFAQGRLEEDEIANALVGARVRWYRRQSDRWLLYTALRGEMAENLDLDNPLEIGGDNGLRGYPLRYQRGTARAQFTIEQRYFTDYYLWRLFRVGAAVFFDAGRVWGSNPFGGENLGLLKDIGIGLRLGSTRSSLGKMVHIDLAFPLDGDPTIDEVQFLIQGKRSF